MSDQQPTPETPHEPEGSGPPASAPAEPPPPAAPGGSVPPPGGSVPPPGGSVPPVWPPHNPPGGPVPTAPGNQPGYPPPSSTAYAPQGYPPPGYPPQGYPYAPAQTTSTNAIVGLVLAILSWVVCPIIPAIVALVLAKKSAEEIASSQGSVGGEGLNTATKIISWINIGFYAALIIIGGAFFLIAVVLGIASGAAG